MKLLSIIILFPLYLYSDSQTSNFNITATVNGSCYINQTTELSFGEYDPNSTTDTESTHQINIKCTEDRDKRYKVTLDGGRSGDSSDRIMYSGTNELHYNIYKKSDHEKIWNEKKKKRSKKKDKTFTGYGLIPAGQQVPPGNYSDTITATLVY
jgi:spore coat protein U-like protein